MLYYYYVSQIYLISNNQLKYQTTMSQHNQYLYNKQNKYNYLQHSFQKQLQRSYDRNCNVSLSPPSMNSPSVVSPNRQNANYNNNSKSRSKGRSPPRSSQFSPYQNKEQNVRDKILVQQLKNHNRILSQQINQYKTMLDKVHIQLRIKSQQFNNLDILRQKQRAIHEQTLAEMKEQIGILLTKNSFLEQRSMALEIQLKRFQHQISKNQARNRSLSAVAANSKQSSSKLIQQLSSLLNNSVKHKKRDNGKLLNQTFSNMNSPKTSGKGNTSTLQSQITQSVEQLIKKIQKYEQLTESIIQMHHKITGGRKLSNDCGQLKTIWKWLKQLGHNYNITQKWKKVLIQVLGLTKIPKAEQMTIDDVLQKTVMQLHSK